MTTEPTKRFIPIAEPDLSSLEESLLIEALRSGWISSIGHFIREFEEQFARFCEADYAVAVSNGTVALDLALMAARVGPGDEVIVPALTFIAVAAAVRHVGAVPVFVDSEPDIGTMDPEAVKAAITPRTKAIIPVHLYGHPADMDPIMDLAEKHGAVVIEDAAEAHGARYKGRRVGSIGHMATFSFYGNKIITTGEGGMVLTNSLEFAQRIRFLKDHAMDPARRYWHSEVGYNFRLTNLQAAIGCAQLRRYDELISKRNTVISRYRDAFSGMPMIAINPSRPWAELAPWLACAILPEGTTRLVNERLQMALKAQGFDTRPYFILGNLMPPYDKCRVVSRFGAGCPVAAALSERGLNLPSPNWLTAEDIGLLRDATAAYMDGLA